MTDKPPARPSVITRIEARADPGAGDVREQTASAYDTDIVTWSERQAELLRRVGAGEHINDLVDWENVAEEIEDVGRSQRGLG